MAYNILFVDKWDSEAQEAVMGGRCVAEVESVEEIPEAVSVARWLARRERWGNGQVIVTDATGLRVDWEALVGLAEAV